MGANVRSIKVRRNEIWLVKLGASDGSEQAGTRPVLIIQNNTGNHFSPTIIVASISSSDSKTKRLPTHVFLEAGLADLKSDSVIMLEQIRTVDKAKFIKKMGVLSKLDAIDADKALSISLALNG